MSNETESRQHPALSIHICAAASSLVQQYTLRKGFKIFPLRSLSLGVATALLFGATGLALASPSGLALIPTADVLPPREYAVSLSSLMTSDEMPEITLNNQVGVMPGVEAGVDFTKHNSPVGNVKGRLPFGKGAVALGAQGLGEESEWYLVYSQPATDTSRARLHAGVLQPLTDVTPFAGAEIPAGDTILLLEGIGGSDRTISLGIALPLREGLDLVLSGIAQRGSDPQLYVDIGYGMVF